MQSNKILLLYLGLAPDLGIFNCLKTLSTQASSNPNCCLRVGRQRYQSKSSVSQGSILGTVLFTIYTTDFSYIAKHNHYHLT